MYSKLFSEPALRDTQAETMVAAKVSATFDYAGANLYSSSDQESASLQTVLVLDISNCQAKAVQMTGLSVSHCGHKNG